MHKWITDAWQPLMKGFLEVYPCGPHNNITWHMKGDPKARKLDEKVIRNMYVDLTVTFRLEVLPCEQHLEQQGEEY